MRISDWRSDVCSSDLEQFVQAYIPPLRLRAGFDYYRAIDQTMRDNESRLTRKLTMPILAIGGEKAAGASVASTMERVSDKVASHFLEIGRASCRERVCQYV